MISNTIKTFALLVIIVLSSCSSSKSGNGLSVQKRRYNKGWHFNSSGNHNNIKTTDTKGKFKRQELAAKKSSEDDLTPNNEPYALSSNENLSFKEKVLKKVLSSKLKKLIKEYEFTPIAELSKVNEENQPPKNGDEKSDEYGDQTNTLAVVAVVLTLFIPIIPLIIGIIALAQIKNNPGKYDKTSKIMAKIAVIYGIVTILLLALMLWLVYSIFSNDSFY
ncbi:MAG: hypothetical protein ACJAZ2_002053 [Glaciecola sp.]|jgi:hypothetical protein